MQINLKFIVDANAIAWHLLDYASNWHYYVHENLGKWVKKNVVERDKLHNILESYANMRTPFGWQEEINLLNWAARGFSDEMFSKLRPLVNDWLELKLNDGRTIKEAANQAEAQIYPYVEILQSKFAALNVDEMVGKLHKLLPEAEIFDELPAYVVWSPIEGSTQGGANGAGVYSEIGIPTSEKTLESTFEVLVHEAFHKLVDPSVTFDSWKELEEIDQKYEHIQEGNQSLNGHLEEMVIYSAVDVMLFGEDPKVMLETNVKSSPKYKQMWEHTYKFFPILDDYVKGRAEADITKERIIAFAREIVGNF